LGGQFVIEPRPGGGTVVHAVIPLTSPRRPA
jgi:signal transduction histidine kinase